MTVVVTTSTDGKIKAFSETSSSVTSAASAVINEMEDHHIPADNIDFCMTHTGSNYTIIAFAKSH